MSELMWVRSHVQLLLQQEWDVCRVTVDDDGDFPFRDGTASGWVHVFDDGIPMVRVFAYAVLGVKRSAKLLTELNDIQSRALTATVLWDSDCVIVRQTINPVGLTRPVLAQAITAVGGIAADIGTLIAGMFGGSTPFPPAAELSDDAHSDSDPR